MTQQNPLQAREHSTLNVGRQREENELEIRRHVSEYNRERIAKRRWRWYGEVVTYRRRGEEKNMQNYNFYAFQTSPGSNSRTY